MRLFLLLSTTEITICRAFKFNSIFLMFLLSKLTNSTIICKIHMYIGRTNVVLVPFYCLNITCAIQVYKIYSFACKDCITAFYIYLLSESLVIQNYCLGFFSIIWKHFNILYNYVLTFFTYYCLIFLHMAYYYL